ARGALTERLHEIVLGVGARRAAPSSSSVGDGPSVGAAASISLVDSSAAPERQRARRHGGRRFVLRLRAVHCELPAARQHDCHPHHPPDSRVAHRGTPFVWGRCFTVLEQQSSCRGVNPPSAPNGIGSMWAHNYMYMEIIGGML